MLEPNAQKQTYLLAKGNGFECYCFARHVLGADIPALQARVLEIGDAEECCLFASNIPGADVVALKERIKKLKENEK